MVKIAKFFAYLSFFILALMYFTPKISIYYFLESQLKNYDVIISSETLADNGFSLNIKSANVIVKTIESATVENLNILILGLYNSVEVENIELSSVAASMIPTKVSTLTIKHQLYDPLHINVNAVGEFGEVKVLLNILERSLHLELIPSTLMKKEYKNTLQNLEKSENGEFTYDKTF